MNHLTVTSNGTSFQRDGTSQVDRVRAALSPDYVAVDERSFEDLLKFIQEYARRLHFIELADGIVQPVGDWSGFLDSDSRLAEVIAFMQEPQRFSPEEARAYTRPHFVLFLTFLQLLRHAQGRLNSFTQRHLDFYYREHLRLTKRPAKPDQVHVLFDLTPGVEQLPIPSGTLLNAGADSSGQNLVYGTDQDLIASRAQVARLSAIYAQKQITGIREAHVGKRLDALMPMLQIALGHPSPGDSLPQYEQRHEFNVDFLEKMRKLVEFVRSGVKESDLRIGLNMTFSSFHALMILRKRRQENFANDISENDDSENEWQKINNILKKVAQNRNGQSEVPHFENPRDFDANFDKVFDFDPNGEIPGFAFDPPRTVYDLANAPQEEAEKQYIRDELKFDPVDDFYLMMKLKAQVDRDWDEIRRILEAGGRQKGTLTGAIELNSPPKPTVEEEFDTYFQQAYAVDSTKIFEELKETEVEESEQLQTIFFPEPAESTEQNLDTLDRYANSLNKVTDYFFLSLENISTMLAIAADPNEQPTTEWERVYAILTDAHRNKIYQDRRACLTKIRKASGFDSMLDHAVNCGQTTDSSLTSLERLKELIQPMSQPDYAFLEKKHTEEESRELSDEEWMDVERIVELAQRTLLPEPVAQKEVWRNLYPAPDVRQFRRDLSTDDDLEIFGWKTFGQLKDLTEERDPLISFGWAISSPLLALSQGVRTITLTLGFSKENEQLGVALEASGEDDRENNLSSFFPIDANQETDGPFLIQISTAKGWIEPDTVAATPGGYGTLLDDAVDDERPALRFTFTFGKAVDALALLPAELADIDTPWPLLRLMLRPLPSEDNTLSSKDMAHYRLFRQLMVAKIHLKTEVEGLVPSQLQNDETILDPTKPFEPFGSNPVVGSRLYLGHPEFLYNQLETLDFNIEWMGAPKNFATHYQNYPEPAENSNFPENDSFTVQIGLIDRKESIWLVANDNLGDGDGNPVPHNLFNKPTGEPTYNRRILETKVSRSYKRHTLAVIDDDDLLGWTQYLQWELQEPDFQHQAYPVVVAQKSIDLATAIADPAQTPDATTYHIKPPYTPKIKSLTLNYTTSVEIDYATPEEDNIEQVFHLYPFGYIELASGKTNPEADMQKITPLFSSDCLCSGVEGNGPDEQEITVSFLPQFDYEGELYIGIQDALPPQQLSLLFQMAEGSADPNLEPQSIQWSYLSGNRWLPIDDGLLLQDTTRGLINSGIVSFALNRLDSIQANTLLPNDLYWLRATIPRHTNSVADTIGIHAQAVSATFIDQGNAPDHLRQSLPAESITRMVNRLAGVGSVRQPYASQDGQMAEDDRTFYTRVSERLRHKHRALTIWDYEHLVLERFPEIYKAKAIPVSPGHVEMIVIPNIKGKVPFDPYEPKAPARLLADISAYLSEIMPPFASIHVRNATYVPIRVRFAVRFYAGVDKEFSKERLNVELNRFLAPWAYDEGADIVIGGRIYANVIVNFLEKQSYVDYIANVNLFEDQKQSDVVERSEKGDWVEAKKPDVVLVSARDHFIDLIPDTGYIAPAFQGIGYMSIGLDFKVAPDPEEQ